MRPSPRSPGAHLKKVALELGGSDPFILLSTDDLDATVQAAVDARLDNTGQSCNAAKRFIVVDDLYDAFLEKFTAAMTSATVGDPFAEDTELGPLSSLVAAERLEEQVAARRRRRVRRSSPAARATARSSRSDRAHRRDRGDGRLPRGVLRPGRHGLPRRRRGRGGRASPTTPRSGSARTSSRPTPAQAERVADQIEAGMVYVNVVLADEPGAAVRRRQAQRARGARWGFWRPTSSSTRS